MFGFYIPGCEILLGLGASLTEMACDQLKGLGEFRAWPY